MEGVSYFEFSLTANPYTVTTPKSNTNIHQPSKIQTTSGMWISLPANIVPSTRNMGTFKKYANWYLISIWMWQLISVTLCIHILHIYDHYFFWLECSMAIWATFYPILMATSGPLSFITNTPPPPTKKKKKKKIHYWALDHIKMWSGTIILD